ncbi:MAG: hypothetical protein H6710_21345 [Myxococcales bacterium]|nr:hypothetical protein [Myxococcales bacterium]
MRGRALSWVGPLVAFGAVVVAPTVTSACSCISNRRPVLYVGAGNRLPADEYGIAWYEEESADLDPARFRLESMDEEGRWVEDTFTLLVHATGVREMTPAHPLRTRFRVSMRPFARDSETGRPGPLQPFSVVEEIERSDVPLDGSAPIELRVGAPRVSELPVLTLRGSCSRRIRAASVRIKAKLPPALDPFLGYLLVETYVDGRLWRPRASLCDHFPRGRTRLSDAKGPGVDVVFSECPGELGEPPSMMGEPMYGDADGRSLHGVAPGEHHVQVIVSSPDGRFQAASEGVRVRLSCDRSPKRSTSDGGTPRLPPPHPPAARGGRCAIDDSPNSAAAALLVVLLAVTARPRRRRSGSSR